MNEAELYQEFRKLQQKIETINLDFQYESDDSKRKELELSKESYSQELQRIKHSLISCQDKSSSCEVKASLNKQLGNFIESFNRIPQNWRITRNQGMIIDDFLLSSISNTLHLSFTNTRISSLPYWIYTLSTKNTIEPILLINFLKSEIECLKRTDENYVSLLEYYNGFNQRLTDEFVI